MLMGLAKERRSGLRPDTPPKGRRPFGNPTSLRAQKYMREIIINGKFLLAALEGMPRVGREITYALDELLTHEQYKSVSIKIYAPKGSKKTISLKNIEIREIGFNQGFLWEQVDLPLFLGQKYSLNFTGTAPVVRKCGCVVVHDAQFRSTPESHSRKSRFLYGTITPIVARRYKTIVTVSHYAKAEIRKFNVSRRDDVHVIPNGADHIVRKAPDNNILDKFDLKADNYILTNSYAHKHKNVEMIFKALEGDGQLCRRLVLFGGSGRNNFERRNINVPQNAIFVGRVSDEELVALMRSARMFLFPSTTEGFGLPPLEAMMLGCPTICSAAGAMPEICGDGVLYASAFDPADWLAKIRFLWHNRIEAKELSERGIRRASIYRWIDSAKLYLEKVWEF